MIFDKKCSTELLRMLPSIVLPFNGCRNQSILVFGVRFDLILVSFLVSQFQSHCSLQFLADVLGRPSLFSFLTSMKKKKSLLFRGRKASSYSSYDS